MKFIITTLTLVSILSFSSFAIDEAQQALEEKNYDLAKKLYSEALISSPNDASILINLAIIYKQMGKLDEADDYVSKALDNITNDDKALVAKASHVHGIINEELAENGNIFSMPSYAKKAKASLKKATELKPNNIKYLSSLVHFYLGAPSLLGGDTEKALHLAEQAISNSSADSYYLLMEVYDKIHYNDSLFALYDKAIKLFENRSAFDFMIAKHWFGKRQYDKAAIYYELAIKHSDNELGIKKLALYDLGRISEYDNSHYDRGIKALEKYVSLHTDRKYSYFPSKDRATYRIANIFQSKGDIDKANKIYRQLLATTSNERLKDDIKDKM